MINSIPFIDLFAGPGGLGEGFSVYCVKDELHPFRPLLSIEKDEHAHSTLELRCFFRQFRHQNRPVPDEYYAHLANELTREELFAAFPTEAVAASNEAFKIELGGEGKGNRPEIVDSRIRKALNKSEIWVLLGGPPCQAYSAVGRNKIIGGMIRKNLNGKAPNAVGSRKLKVARDKAEREFSKDSRHTLYREYIRIIAKHSPPVFVMENVRGILSSKRNGERIFPKILQDMKDPFSVVNEYWPRKRFSRNQYKIYSFVTGKQPDIGSEDDYLIITGSIK